MSLSLVSVILNMLLAFVNRSICLNGKEEYVPVALWIKRLITLVDDEHGATHFEQFGLALTWTTLTVTMLYILFKDEKLKALTIILFITP